MSKSLFILAAAIFASSSLYAGLNVVPAVQSWTPADGIFTGKKAAIYLQKENADTLSDAARMFSADLDTVGCGKHRVVTGEASSGSPAFVLTLDHGGNVIQREGYRIEIGIQIIVRGSSPTGVYYGTRTLLQLLSQNPREQTLPHGVIVDWPQYRHRMLMLDVGRKPFPMTVLKDYLRIMAWYKMNELHLHFSDEAFGGHYTGFRIQCDTFPGLASKDLHYTKKEIRELQDAARAVGITITPEIDMPGHSRCFTDYWPDIMIKDQPNYMDVTNPKTIELMKKLLDEMIPLFDAPDFHIGTDEYRVRGTKEEREKLHEAFRQFINTMNAHVHSKGKTTRIWSGFENMMGTTQIDPSVTIDMWETDDANGQISKGHKVINSNHGRTYIVPGAHYYGVSNPGIYNGWEPWMVSGEADKNPSKDSAALLGGKLHIWNDQGPTGYTLTEIAELMLPSLQVISEKLWGTKGSEDYAAFQPRAAKTLPVPGVAMLDRAPANSKGLMLDLPHEQSLATTNSIIPLPFSNKERRDLEHPWTLTFDVCKTSETGRRGVILSSDLAEICSDFTYTKEVKSKDAGGKEVKTKVAKTGLGVVRAAGSPGDDAASAHLANDLSRVYADTLPLNEWTPIVIVGDRRRTTVYINGKRTGVESEQTLCPLGQLGSKTGNSFVGKVRNLKVYNRALYIGEAQGGIKKQEGSSIRLEP